MQVKVFKVSNGKIKNRCYLIYRGRNGLLIDPAWDYELINRFLVEHNIRLSGILLTHSHRDHTDLAARFSASKGVQVMMSAKEIEASGFSLPNLVSLYHHHKVQTTIFQILPIVTPGHTLGSTCYLIGQHLFTGDTVFTEGVGLCTKENAPLLFQSVQRLKETIAPETKVWPGHSYGAEPGQSFAFINKNNIYFHLKEAQFIELRTRKNQPDPYAFK